MQGPKISNIIEKRLKIAKNVLGEIGKIKNISNLANWIENRDFLVVFLNLTIKNTS